MIEMKAGDIIFVRGTDIISSLIKFFDQGEFSHVAIAVSSTHIFEAQYGSKAHIVPFYFEDVEVIDLNLTDQERDMVVHIAIQFCGKHYDLKQVMWYILKYIFKLEGRNKWNSPNNVICSEVIEFILQSLGKIPIDQSFGDRTPNVLYKYLMKMKGSQTNDQR